MTRIAAVAAVLSIVVSVAPSIARGEILSGPFSAEVLRVYDGDTFRAKVRIWLGQDVIVWVRLVGVDTPELGRRARCAEENEKAKAARDYLAGLLGSDPVILRDVRGDKYQGRIDAVVTAHGIDVAAELVAKGYGRPYDGRARRSWCG